jgi:hypothetical protein
MAHLVRLTSLPEGRPSDFHKADELPGFYQSIAAMESIGLEKPASHNQAARKSKS